ncbi:VOC family protein [Chitinophaga pendula]|uniref:VOC family protein n=1 Tax=Chitinophaga TaxID=79328 RepID=UPI000BAF55E4|nr:MULTISPECIES: VOC family protein [Chitinophaga]ASZ13158.1 bleomycin resistance family protein [Chitinophaga sp. MD30]UCJ09217.1 VOC family protein [Chitinophaga pendula]
MTPECAATIFSVSDLAASLKYYVDTLGFAIDFEYGAIAGLYYGNVLLQLSGPDHAGNRKATGEGHMYVFCDEVDQYFQDIVAKGALAIVAPADREYGMRDFAIRDADGNILAFGKANHS